ncbi:hypothetical protein HWV62_8481 [Athelia sp. TMB]|nr:hypothetical protein HWV62_8481 [Athelia sp. TMB]
MLLAWAPLTIIITVAIYLHLRGFPGGDADGAPVPPPVEELATLANTDELIREDEASAHPAPGATAGPPDDIVTSPNRAATSSQVVQQLPDLVAELPTVLDRENLAKANALRDQSAVLLDLGQRQEALAAITEATDSFRALALKYPAFKGELSLSLRVLSSRLGDVGQKEEALLAIEEAVELQRPLANERPSEFDVELASSLNHQSNRLSRLDRHEEALLASQESVDLYRILVEQQPESHKPGLAASLFNLFNRLSRYDLQEEALVAIQEASGLYRELAAEQPAIYERNLALSLKKLSGCREGSHQQVATTSGSQPTAKFGSPSTSGTHNGTSSAPGLSESIAPGSDPVALGQPTFHTTGSAVVTNVAGNYNHITGDEAPMAKISRQLPYADGASWDPKLTCLPGTRLTMLGILIEWAKGAGSEKICWLSGVAGSGKSAILHSIAQALKRDGYLASAFFFGRDTASRNTAKNLFTTLARDIASLSSRAAEDIAEALEAEPSLATAPLSRQFDALILGPCRHLPTDRPAVFVIDALDESITHDLDTELLTILRDKATQFPPQVRILITSRPTNTIEEYLSRRNHVVAHSIDVHSAENKVDIDMYVDTQLRDEVILHKMGLTSPDEAIIRDLKRLAEGLFVWIVTICNFLRTAHRPKDKLQALLSKSSQQGTHPEKKMDQLYAAILAECGDWEDADFVKDYDLVIGTIMALKQPLSLAALRALHDGSLDLGAEQLLQRFGSVLTGFRDAHQPIRILHLSFHEFVTDRAANDDSTKCFHLSEKEHSSRLAELCVKTLNRELEKPIPGTGYLNKRSDEIPGIPTILHVSEQLVYGCAHWPSHLQDVETPQTIQAHLITLISRHLVTWMEVLATTDIFHGSLQIGQWVQQHAPHLEHHFQHHSQAYAVSALGNRLGYAARMEESLLAAQEAVVLFRALARQQPAMYSGVLASCLSNLAGRLSDLGRAHDALSAVEEAVRLYKPLAAERPAAYKADLAKSLNNLSLHLSDLGQARDALSAAEEAVHLYRPLAAERPAAYNADLAMSLSNFSNHLSSLGRAQEALSAVQEAVNLKRALAAERPAAYSDDLASSLTNLSTHLSNLGRAQEALSAVQEAVDLHRALAAERPAACNADLATSLNNFSNCLSALGRAQEALSAVEEAVNLRRALAAERPAAYNADLASSLANLAAQLSAHGRAQEALSAVEEAVNLKRALAAERPAAHNADLAMCLSNLSNHLSALGQAQEALSAVEESVHLRRALAAERPAAYNADLAASLNGLSNRLSDFGRAQEALLAGEEAVNLRRALAAERPAAHNADLAGSLTNLSMHLSALGRSQEALSAGDEAVNLYRPLAAERPAAYNADLAASLTNLSNYLSALGRAQEALSAGEEAVHLYRALAAERPAAYNADFAASLNGLSNRLSAFGRAQEALSAAEEAVHLYRPLAAERPAAYNADLAKVLCNLSNRLSELGRTQVALSAAEEAVILFRSLAPERPAAYNAYLAQSLQAVSLRLIDLGRHDEALVAIPEAVELCRALAAERPAQFNQLLMISLQLLNKAIVGLGLDVPVEISEEIRILQPQVA